LRPAHGSGQGSPVVLLGIFGMGLMAEQPSYLQVRETDNTNPLG